MTEPLPADVQKARFLHAMGELAALLPEAEFARVSRDADRLLEAIGRGDAENCIIGDTTKAMLVLAFKFAAGEFDIERFVTAALKIRRMRRHGVN